MEFVDKNDRYIPTSHGLFYF